jgi:hypothetical protein
MSDGTYPEVSTLDIGRSDVTLAADLFGNEAGLVFRALDPDNYLMARYNNATLYLYHRSGGIWEDVGTAPVTAAASHRLAVSAQGDRIELYSDGVLALQATVTALQTATRHGLLWHRRTTSGSTTSC